MTDFGFLKERLPQHYDVNPTGKLRLANDKGHRKTPKPLVLSSEGAGGRTQDQRIKSPLLYRLSYAFKKLEFTGFPSVFNISHESRELYHFTLFQSQKERVLYRSVPRIVGKDTPRTSRFGRDRERVQR